MKHASRSTHDGVRRASEPIRSERGGAGLGWGGAGTRPRVAEGEVREDLRDDRGIVQRGDQAKAASKESARAPAALRGGQAERLWARY
jgi:hypothetical protein